MGRIVFVMSNNKTGENKKYYHKLIRHYEDGMCVFQLKENLTKLLSFGPYILTNSRSMILNNFSNLYGNRVLCVLDYDTFFESLKGNLVYIGCNENVDYDSDDLESECCADMPELEPNTQETREEVD